MEDAGSKPEEKKEKTFSQKIATADVSTLSNILRVINILNAMLLGAVGVLTFIFNSRPSLPLSLSAIYVIAFSLLLLCFETHFSFVEKVVYRDCGFMFHWPGRCLFLIFTGTLAFGLGTIGIIAGAITAGNVLFNLYALKMNKTYEIYMSKQGEQYRARAANFDRAEVAATAASVAGATPGQSAVVGAAVAAHQSAPGGDSAGAGAGAGAGGGGGGGNSDWEKIYDEESQTYYYYNSKTKETRWDAPP